MLALYLQPGRGLDPLQSGLVVSIMAGAYLVASLRAPALTARFGRSLTAAGALILAAGHGVLLLAIAAVGVGGIVLWLAPGLLLIGGGMGLCLTAAEYQRPGSCDPGDGRGHLRRHVHHAAGRQRAGRGGHRSDLLRGAGAAATATPWC